MKHRLRSQSGMALIHVGILLLGVMGLSAIVLDYGVFWLARGQAQNVADAGALAGATTLVYTDFKDLSDAGPAHQAAVATIQQNKVMGEVPGYHVDQSADLAWESPAPLPCSQGKGPGTCVQANIYRDGTHTSNPLPTYFANLFGVTKQNIKATATAQILSATRTTCMKPWMAADKTDATTYDFSDIGTLLVLRENIAPSQYRQADLNKSGAANNCPGGGGKCYSEAIVGCVGKDSDGTFNVGDPITEKPGGTVGPNGRSRDIFNQDPTATWNTVTKEVDNSCALTNSCLCKNLTNNGCANGLNGAISPRIITVALFKPSDLAALGGGGGKTAPIQNFAGVFLLQPGTGPDPACTMTEQNVCGYLVPTPTGELGAAVPGSSLNVKIVLVR